MRADGRIRYLGMTALPRPVEEALCAAPTWWLVQRWNAAVGRPRLLDAGDKYHVIQLIARHRPELATSIINSEEYSKVKLSEIPLATMDQLVEEYNKHAEKPVKGFRNRATAEERVAAVLPTQRGRRPVAQLIRALEGGESSVRADSTRGQVLAFIREKGEVLKADVDRKFGVNTAGFIGKLAEKKHVEIVAAPQQAAGDEQAATAAPEEATA